ncbi:MAG TPA: hypothetical protein VH643_16590 [Gemmataceae bacterium]|jgi:hypothetical protein
MAENMGILGYGFSREGRDADWQELEAELSAKGPDCPLTADLLDLALNWGQGSDAQRVREHLDSGCAYCRGRFEAQQRAIAQAEELPIAPMDVPRVPAVGPSIFERVSARLRERTTTPRRLVGEMKPVLRLAGDSGPRKRPFQVALREEGAEAGPDVLNVEVSFYQPDPTAAKTWSLELYAPVKNRDGEHVNAEPRLRELDGRAVRLVLKSADFAPVKKLTTALDWDPAGQQLVSLNSTLEIDDPARIKYLELLPRKRIDGLQTS